MTARKVVFAPDVLVGALFNPAAREILNKWRDGEIMPVVTRELLVIYARTLSQAGLTPDLIRKWSLWLTTTGKSIYIESAAPSEGTSRNSLKNLEVCRAVAERHAAEVVTARKGTQ